MAEMTNEEFFKDVIDMDFMEFIKTDEDFRENTYTLGEQTLIGYGFAYIYRGEMNTADMEKWVNLKTTKKRPLDNVIGNDGPMNRGVADEWFLFLMRYEFYPQLVHYLKKGESVIQDVMKDLTKGQRSALLDLFYNSGSDNFTESEIYKRVKKNPNDPALPGIIESYNLKYPGLIDRRKVTAHLYATNEVKTDINVSYKYNNEQNSYSLNEIRYINTNHCNAIKCNDSTQTNGDTQSNDSGSDVMNKSKINGKSCKIRIINEIMENDRFQIQNAVPINDEYGYQYGSRILIGDKGEMKEIAEIQFSFNNKGYHSSDIKIKPQTENIKKLSKQTQQIVNDILNKKYDTEITDEDISKFENGLVLKYVNKFYQKCKNKCNNVCIHLPSTSTATLCKYKKMINQSKISEINKYMIQDGYRIARIDDVCNIEGVDDIYNINDSQILILRLNHKDEWKVVSNLYVFKYTFSPVEGDDNDNTSITINSIQQIFVEPTSNK